MINYILKRQFLCRHEPHYGLVIVRELGSIFVEVGWMVLRWRANDNVEGTYHLTHLEQIYNRKDTLEKCKMMGAMYVPQLRTTQMKGFLIYIFLTHQNSLVESLIQVTKKCV